MPVAAPAASPAPSDAAPAAPPPPPKRKRGWGRRIAVALGLVVVLVALVLGAFWWSLGNEAGTGWLLARLQNWVPGLVIEGAQGSLRGGDFSASRVVVPLAGEPGQPGGRLVLDGVRWSGLEVTRLLRRTPHAHLHFDTLEADRATLELPPSQKKTEPAEPPKSLALPVTVDIDALRLGELHAAALGDKPVRDVRARVALGAEGGAEHRVENLSFAWDRLTGRAAARIATGGSLDLDASLAVEGDSGDPRLGKWAASIVARGPLERIETSATLRGMGPGAAGATPDAAAGAARPQSAASAPAGAASAAVATPAPGGAAAAATPSPAGGALPAVDLTATVLPFADWPLGALQGRVQALDLSALASGLPKTRIDATAKATSSAADRPVGIAVELRNGLAGRWDEARLPVRSARLDVRSRLDDMTTIELPALELQLGGERPAGRLSGSGRWKAPGWTLDLVLDDVLPAQLDARAPAMRLSGPVKLRGEGFGTAAASSGGASAPQSGGTATAQAPRAPASAGAAAPRTATAAAPLPSVDIDADLAGELLPPSGSRLSGRPLRLAAEARANADDIQVRRFVAASGKARAEGSGRASRKDAAAPWHLVGQARLNDFDPAPWLPTTVPAAWQRGPHRLNAAGQWDLTLPPPATAPAAGRTAAAPPGRPPTGGGNPLAALAGIAGSASVAVTDSLLAGVPLKADVSLRGAGGRGDALQLAARVDAAGNTASIDGTLDLHGAGAADRWAVRAGAPALARLAPLLRLAGLEGAAASLSGAVAAEAQLSGRWPQISTQGSAGVRQLQAGGAAGVSIADGSLRWQLGTAAGAPTRLDLGLSGVRAGEMIVDSARAQLQGTAAAHDLELRAELRGRPPAWAEQVQAALAGDPVTAPAAPSAPGERTVVSLQARGGLDTRAAPRWRGTVQRLVAASSRAGRPPWASVQNVDIDVQAAGERTPARAEVAAGRASVLGAAVRWDRIAWQGASGSQPQRLDARAEVSPLPVAPILNTLQPDFGWGGDLRVTAEAVVRSGPNVQVDVVVQRASGDLTVTDEAGTRPLGLTDLRLGAVANNGVWHFTQAFAGRRLGNAAGAVTVRTSPQAFWPPPEAPMQGVLEAHVEDLSSWAAWLPAGWRLSGRIDTTASIGGRFGAPEVSGTVTGSGIGVRNVLEGINVTDGDLRISLAGDTARIERFVLRGGAGTLRVEGGAHLGRGLSSASTAPGAPPPVAPPPRADLRLFAERFRLLARVDRRIVASGQARMRLEGSKAQLTGAFRVDEGLVDFTRSDAPSLSDDVVVIRSADRPDPNAVPKPPADASDTPFQLALDVNVDLGNNLRLRGRGIDTGLAGSLHITAPKERLAVNGSVRTVGGTYNAYNQKLTIDRGVITFTGPIENPRLDILALRTAAATEISDVRVGVVVTGTAVAPRVRLFSEPEMSETSKLAYLVLGRAPDSLGGTEISILQQAAVALLSGEREGGTSKLTRALGLDVLSVRQGTGGSLQSAIVSVGKQLSSRWYVGYERGLNATAGNIQLVYRVARRLTIRGQSGLDNSLDVIWTWRWQ